MMFSSPLSSMPYYNRYSRYGYRYPSSAYIPYPQDKAHTQKKENTVVNSNAKSSPRRPSSSRYSQKEEQPKQRYPQSNYPHYQQQKHNQQHNQQYNQQQFQQNKQQQQNNSQYHNINQNQNQKQNQNENQNQKKEENRGLFDFDSPLFQILGIDLYFDDILILCLLFFLYQEGVKDQGLFISLILLLLS